MAWRQEERAFATVASQILDRLDDMEFSEKQHLIALLDVRVDLESDGRISASLSAPKPSDLAPVPPADRLLSPTKLTAFAPAVMRERIAVDDTKRHPPNSELPDRSNLTAASPTAGSHQSGASVGRLCGRAKRKVAPPPDVSSTQIRPPSASTSSWQMYSPTPRPPCALVELPSP